MVAHEITHAFDDFGRRVDFDGNIFDWWTIETKKNYLEKSQCIKQQYGNYTDEQVGMRVC